MKFLFIAALLFSGLAHAQSGQCGFKHPSCKTLPACMGGGHALAILTGKKDRKAVGGHDDAGHLGLVGKTRIGGGEMVGIGLDADRTVDLVQPGWRL